MPRKNPGAPIVRSNYFFVNIAPNTTKTLELSISSEDDVLAYFSVPANWIELANRKTSPERLKNGRLMEKHETNGSAYCCMKEGFDCVNDMIALRLDVASIVTGIIAVVAPETSAIAEAVSWADCAFSVFDTSTSVIGDFLCNANEESVKEKLIEELSKQKQNFLATVLSCISVKLKEMKAILASTGAAISGNVDFNSGEILRSLSNKISSLTYWGTLTEGIKCFEKFTTPKPNCPPNPTNGGGTSSSVASLDPNDIFGYTAESGSHAVKDSLTDVYYRIEFENDTAFATASAHDIYVTDTLDASKFDLSTFKPTRVRIGEKSAELTGEKNFVTTIDMRPEINAIAQVEGTFDQKKGIAKWHISSLDPMTMEPTKYVMDGVLPVNTDGRGLGELSFDISLKPGLAHGTEVKNRAGIVFDTNDVIMTPIWTNTIDREKPTSRVVDATVLPGGETAAISIETSDDGSGPWRYDVYVQYGSGAWFLAAENVAADTTATVKLYDGIEHHFYSVARDMAGNVEQKEPHAELTLTVSDRLHGDANGDGKVDVADIAEIIDTMAGDTYRRHSDANGDGTVDVADIAEVISIMAAAARKAAAAVAAVAAEAEALGE